MKSLLSLCVIFSIFVGILNAEPHAGSATVTLNGASILITGGQITEPLCFDGSSDDFKSVSNDCYFYNSLGLYFSEEACPSFSVPRVHHTAVVYNNNTYLFGGAGKNNDIEEFDGQAWSIVDTLDDGYSWTPLGDRPNGRYGHGAVVVDDVMFIFGGIDSKSGNALNDMWTFNFITHEWQELDIQGWVPQARAGFSFTLVEDKVYLFGGFDTSSPNRYFNDLWYFTFGTQTWKHAAGSTQNFVAPEPRAYHVAGVARGQLFVQGGSAPNRQLNGTVTYFGNLWSIKLDTLDAGSSKWSRSPMSPDVPTPGERAQHTLAEIEEDYFVLFAGVDSSRETIGDSWTIYFVDPSTVTVSAAEVGEDDNTGHDDEEHPDWDAEHGHWTGHTSSHWVYAGLVAEYAQADCFTGYYFPYCVRDCSANNFCSGNGQCLSDGSCCCNEGFSGDSCEINECIPYRGFTSDLLNEILLPKTLESTYMKLDTISKKLEIIRDLLPNIQTYDVDMKNIAEESFNFYQSCLVDDLCETTESFEELIGCDMPCGTETFCLLNDICVNNECINGTWRDCSEEFGNNKCVNSWCDETHGCMHSTVSCDDGDMCTEDTCDPTKGCVHKTITCHDDDCCTTDQCNPKTGVCEYQDKCEDYNPCTIDTCSSECQWGTCEYEIEDCCYLSQGQNPVLNPTTTVVRPLGDRTPLDGYQTIPEQSGLDTADHNVATAMYWLRACDCELIYDIQIEDRPSVEGLRVETGAHIYGVAEWYENAGVVYSLPLGNTKKGVWNFCESGVRPEDLIAGKFYTQIYFNVGGAIRGQIEFIQDPIEKRESGENFRG